MDIRNSKTYENLTSAFLTECKDCTKYILFSRKAEEDGFFQISEIFRKTAENELTHALIILERLEGISYTSHNLQDAVAWEEKESEKLYTDFSAKAKEEGFYSISKLFDRLAQVEKKHSEIFSKLEENMDTAKIFCKDEKRLWVCRACGYETYGECSREVCPLCGSGQEHSEIKGENY